MRSALTRLVRSAHESDVSRERERRHHSSFPGRFSQGLVDPLLPAGAAFLEEFENILVDAQGDELLRDRGSSAPSARFRRASSSPI